MSTDTKQLEFNREFALPPSRMWELLIDPKNREQWGAPEEGMVLQVEKADTREGGYERHRCGPADAPEFLVDTRWYRLAEPELAVYTETLLVGDDLIFTSLVTYALRASDKGSALDVAVAISSFVGEDTFDEVQAGWEGGLANLEGLVTKELQGSAA